MINFLNYIISVFLLIFTLSYAQDKNEVYENTLDNKDVKLSKTSQFVIQEDSSTYISRISSVHTKFYNKELVISDRENATLFFIDLNGKIRKTLKFNFGSGPGEIIKLTWFCIMEDKIYISDDGNWRWTVVDTSGQYITSAKPFIETASETSQNGLYECAFKIEHYDDKIYVPIFEAKYLGDENYKSKTFAILDTNLVIKKIFGRSNELYRKIKINNTAKQFFIDPDGNIYYVQDSAFRILKYDKECNLVKIFGVKNKFKEINEYISPFNPRSKNTFNQKAKYSSSTNLLYSSNGYILHVFTHLTEKFYWSKSPLDLKNYLKVYDLDGNYIPSDIRLPGMLLAVTDDGKLLIYENEEPDNNRIGIYELEITDN